MLCSLPRGDPGASTRPGGLQLVPAVTPLPGAQHACRACRRDPAADVKKERRRERSSGGQRGRSCCDARRHPALILPAKASQPTAAHHQFSVPWAGIPPTGSESPAFSEHTRPALPQGGIQTATPTPPHTRPNRAAVRPGVCRKSTISLLPCPSPTLTPSPSCSAPPPPPSPVEACAPPRQADTPP